MEEYKWTLKDAQAIGKFMGEVEGTIKMICACVMALTASAIILLLCLSLAA